MSRSFRRALALVLAVAPTSTRAQPPIFPPQYAPPEPPRHASPQPPAAPPILRPSRPSVPTQSPAPAPPSAPPQANPRTPAAPSADPPTTTAPPQPSTAQSPASRGTGLLVSGGVLLGVGVPLLIIGLAGRGGQCWSVGGSCDESETRPKQGGGVIAAGIVGVLGGVTLLVLGAARRSALRDRKPTPAITRSPAGTWLPGLVLRF